MTRSIEPAMVDYLRKRLESVGLFHEAVRNKDARTLYLLANQACVGVREKSGRNDGPIVELMQRTLGGADREPWCMSAQQTFVAFAEELTGIVSRLFPSEHCMTVYRNTPIDLRVKTRPLPGATTIWNHLGTDSGHTGATGTFWPRLNTFDSYEGNTEGGLEGGEVVREGGGFYFLRRSAAGTGRMRLVGWLKPFPSL